MNTLTARYKLRKFIDSIILNKLLTDDYISICSKGIFEFIRNNNKLQEIYKGMTLSELSQDGIITEYWINWKGNRLLIDDLIHLA